MIQTADKISDKKAMADTLVGSKTPCLENLDPIPQQHAIDQINRTPLYFGTTEKTLMGWLHKSKNEPQQKSAIIICPPLALEYMNSYRSLRWIADYFALAGFPVLRFDYHGTGDSSGSNLDENRLPDWLESIELAYEYVKTITGINSVGLFGFRMGAALGVISAEKIQYDFMVLWDPIERGKRFIREIKILQNTSAIAEDENAINILEAGGGVYWDATAKAIQSINLLDCNPKTSRLLLVPGDSLTINTKLLDSFKLRGIPTEQLVLDGSSSMLFDAHLTKVPHQSITKIVAWVKNTSNCTTRDNNTGIIKALPEQQSKELTSFLNLSSLKQKCQIEYLVCDPESCSEKDFKIDESFVYFGEQRDRFAIKSAPNGECDPELPIIIISNSGTNHRVGPSRLYVQLARQLAGLGFVVYRLDLPGIGDSIVGNSISENMEYLDNGTEEILSAIGTISKEYEDAKFVVAGLCSGAYFSFHTALESRQNNIVEIFMINPLTFYWEKGMTAETSTAKDFRDWNWYSQAILSSESWKKLFSGQANYSNLINTLYQRVRLKLRLSFGFAPSSNEKKKNSKTRNDLGRDLELVSKSSQLTFLLSSLDPGYDLLTTLGGSKVKRLIRDKKLIMLFVAHADHTFSKFEPRCSAIKLTIEHFVRTYKNTDNQI